MRNYRVGVHEMGFAKKVASFQIYMIKHVLHRNTNVSNDA
jgi:hypothetical protein